MIERYLSISRVNLKHHMLPHIIVAVGLFFLAPFIMGVRNLDLYYTAKVLDTYVSLFGIVLLVPLFLPDQDKDIRELIRSKRESIVVLHFIRMGQALLVLSIFVASFLAFLQKGNCIFPFGRYFYGTMSSCIFLGGLGILIYAFVDNIAAVYMVPLMYYILCYGGGKKYLGKFYLFSMFNGTVEDKIYLLIAGLVMIIAGILIRKRFPG